MLGCRLIFKNFIIVSKRKNKLEINLYQKNENYSSKENLRDYMSNIWGNVRIAIMGAGQGVWPKIFFWSI